MAEKIVIWSKPYLQAMNNDLIIIIQAHQQMRRLKENVTTKTVLGSSAYIKLF